MSPAQALKSVNNFSNLDNKPTSSVLFHGPADLMTGTKCQKRESKQTKREFSCIAAAAVAGPPFRMIPLRLPSSSRESIRHVPLQLDVVPLKKHEAYSRRAMQFQSLYFSFLRASSSQLHNTHTLGCKNFNYYTNYWLLNKPHQSLLHKKISQSQRVSSENPFSWKSLKIGSVSVKGIIKNIFNLQVRPAS